MDRIKRIVGILVLLATFTGQPMKTLAADAAIAWQDHASIRVTAKSWLEAFVDGQHQGRSEVSLGNLDSRLRLKACSLPLEASLASGGRTLGNTTVSVRCPDTGGWNIYVSARIDVFGSVLAARQPLTRGSEVREQDLELVERNLGNLPYGYYSDPADISGMMAKRTINATTVITPQMLQAPRLVRRGERVTLVAETGGLQVRMAGQAMSDGTSGDLVRVRAQGSQRIVDGIVISPGVIKVTL